MINEKMIIFLKLRIKKIDTILFFLFDYACSFQIFAQNILFCFVCYY